MATPDHSLLEEVLSPRRILRTRAESKSALLKEILDSLADCGEVADLEGLRSAILQRESLMSTGIGLGVGVPHARISSVRDMILAVAVNETPLADYESIDGEPVQIVFLVAGRPDQQSRYVRLLAVLSHLVKDPERRDDLRSAGTPEDIYRILHPSG